jgi:phosphate uptake regulator
VIKIKRKIIQIANSTMLVSLPLPWAKKNNLKKGEDIELTVKSPTELIISTKPNFSIEKISIDLSGKKELIEKIIAALYKAGYDEAEVSFSSVDELEEIHRVIGAGLIGYEIVDEKNNFLIIKAVSTIELKEFDPMLRRCFLFIISMGEDTIHALKNDRQELKNIIIRDSNVNKISDFLRRSLNKSLDSGFKKPNAIYCIVEGLEKIGDMYKDLSQYCLSFDKELSKQELEVLNETNLMFRKYYDCFFNFKIDSIYEIHNLRKKIKEMIIALEKQKNSDKRFIYKIDSLSLSIKDLSGVLMLNFV